MSKVVQVHQADPNAFLSVEPRLQEAILQADLSFDFIESGSFPKVLIEDSTPEEMSSDIRAYIDNDPLCVMTRAVIVSYRGSVRVTMQFAPSYGTFVIYFRNRFGKFVCFNPMTGYTRIYSFVASDKHPIWTQYNRLMDALERVNEQS